MIWKNKISIRLIDWKFQKFENFGKIENYFHEEINQRKSCNKKLRKYLAAFDYIDKVLIVLSATSGGVSIISFTSIVGAISRTTRIVKKLLNITRNENKKHDKILMLAKS